MRKKTARGAAKTRAAKVGAAKASSAKTSSAKRKAAVPDLARPKAGPLAGEPRNGQSVDELLAHLRSFEGVPFVPFAQYEQSLKRLLELEFKPAKSGFVEASALSDRQRELLRAISGCRFGGMPFYMFGIPTDLRTRRRWLGIDPPLALERPNVLEMAGLAPEGPLWRALSRTRLTDDKLDEALRARLSPADVCEVYGEQCLDAYALPPPHTTLVDAAFARAGAAAIPYAQNLVDYVAENPRRWPDGEVAYGYGAGATNCALALLLRRPTAAPLDPRYDCVVGIGGSWRETTREILEALPLERRVAIFVDMLRREGFSDLTLQMMAAYIDKAPDAGLVKQIAARIAKHPDSSERKDMKDAIVPALEAMAAAHPSIAQTVRALKKVS